MEKRRDVDRCRLLVVEDQLELREALVESLSERCSTVRAVGSLADARNLLENWVPDVLIADVVLPDGDIGELVQELEERRPSPAVIAMSGRATPSQAFELARLGVRTYLAKPIRLEDLEEALAQALSAPPSLVPHLKQSVGIVELTRLEESVRREVVEEALARSNGSKRGAARLLGISRQLLQYIVKEQLRVD